MFGLNLEPNLRPKWPRTSTQNHLQHGFLRPPFCEKNVHPIIDFLTEQAELLMCFVMMCLQNQKQGFHGSRGSNRVLDRGEREVELGKITFFRSNPLIAKGQICATSWAGNEHPCRSQVCFNFLTSMKRVFKNAED